MFPFLKLYSSSHHVFSPVSKIFFVLKRDAKLFLLRFSSSIKHRITERDKKAEHKNQDKVIVYQNNNSQYFNKIKLFSVSNFIIWTLFGINVYDSLSKEPNLLNDELKQKWIENKGKRELTKKLIIGSITFGLCLDTAWRWSGVPSNGFLFVLAIWFYLLRSIKQIQLIKSTKIVEFQTHSFFPSVREFSVPLRDVSGVISRHAAKGHLPIKIKDTWFYFLIDIKGHFPDTFLFDNSVGVKRDFKNSKYD